MRAATCLALALVAFPMEAPPYDLVLAGGTIVDGSGRPPFRADVAIANGRIAAVGRIAGGRAAAVASVGGLTVAPGFVATHGRDALDCSSPAPAIAGITTIVLGADGVSAADVAANLADIHERRPIVNCATLVGHATVHAAVMGDRVGLPTPSQLARMRALVWKGMADGALGFSSGPSDAPATSAAFAEFEELVRVAANAGGVFAATLPPGAALDPTLDAVVRIADATGGRLQLSRLERVDQARMADLMRKLRAARAGGVDVQADVDPAHAGAAMLADPNVAFQGDPSSGYPLAALAAVIRSRSVLSVQDAVRKLSTMPAVRYRLAGRGEIRTGAAADLVIFDAARLADASSVVVPRLVLVNGVAVVHDGVQTGARPGQPLAHSLMERRAPRAAAAAIPPR
jgi:N-acyl-D-aspartate/D-glutamate deacylase